jgi:hypothetical protein
LKWRVWRWKKVKFNNRPVTGLYSSLYYTKWGGLRTDFIGMLCHACFVNHKLCIHNFGFVKFSSAQFMCMLLRVFGAFEYL